VSAATLPAGGLSLFAFCGLGQRLAQVAREIHLVAPSFRNDPAFGDRTIEREGRIVRVRVRGRSAEDVARDLVEGILAANGEPLDGPKRAAFDEAVTEWRAA
jgi:predicted trehalose synthase